MAEACAVVREKTYWSEFGRHIYKLLLQRMSSSVAFDIGAGKTVTGMRTQVMYPYSITAEVTQNGVKAKIVVTDASIDDDPDPDPDPTRLFANAHGKGERIARFQLVGGGRRWELEQVDGTPIFKLRHSEARGRRLISARPLFGHRPDWAWFATVPRYSNLRLSTNATARMFAGAGHGNIANLKIESQLLAIVTFEMRRIVNNAARAAAGRVAYSGASCSARNEYLLAVVAMLVLLDRRIVAPDVTTQMASDVFGSDAQYGEIADLSPRLDIETLGGFGGMDDSVQSLDALPAVCLGLSPCVPSEWRVLPDRELIMLGSFGWIGVHEVETGAINTDASNREVAPWFCAEPQDCEAAYRFAPSLKYADCWGTTSSLPCLDAVPCYSREYGSYVYQLTPDGDAPLPAPTRAGTASLLLIPGHAHGQ